jgi:hypothetical protein
VVGTESGRRVNRPLAPSLKRRGTPEPSFSRRRRRGGSRTAPTWTWTLAYAGVIPPQIAQHPTRTILYPPFLQYAQ